MDDHINGDRVLPIALVYFAAALLERCEVLLARLSKPVVEEIEAFRAAALAHISAMPDPVTEERGRADAVSMAVAHVNDVCDGWLAVERVQG